jgi:hypothetical protein
MVDRLAVWALKRAYGDVGDAGGVRLLAVDEKGSIRDLGAYAVKDLEGLAWAVGVAYRRTPERWERTRLAGLKPVARRLVGGIRGKGVHQAR